MLCNVLDYCFCNSYVYRINLAKYLANVRYVMPCPSPIPLAPQSSCTAINCLQQSVNVNTY